jgi:hypothetical protein
MNSHTMHPSSTRDTVMKEIVDVNYLSSTYMLTIISSSSLFSLFSINLHLSEVPDSTCQDSSHGRGKSPRRKQATIKGKGENSSLSLSLERETFAHSIGCIYLGLLCCLSRKQCATVYCRSSKSADAT